MVNGNVSRLIEMDTQTRKRILVLGDAVTDVYITGYTSECQDNCVKFVEQNRIIVPGGALNAARSLQDWSCIPIPVVQMGNIPIKTRFVSAGKFVLRHDLESTEDYSKSQRAAERALNLDVDAVLISDYCKGFLTRELIRFAIEVAVARGIPCVVDAKRPPDVYAGAVLKCNNAYASVYSEVLHRKDTVITYGSVCPTVVNRVLKDCWKHQVSCVNHVGAGDCFAAHLTLALAQGFKLEDAAAVAHSAGRVYVQYPFNRPPLKMEILADTES